MMSSLGPVSLPSFANDLFHEITMDTVIPNSNLIRSEVSSAISKGHCHRKIRVSNIKPSLIKPERFDSNDIAIIDSAHIA